MSEFQMHDVDELPLTANQAIGVFDSGSGGMVTAAFIARICPIRVPWQASCSSGTPSICRTASVRNKTSPSCPTTSSSAGADLP